MPKVRRCRAVGCHNLVTTDHWYCEQHRDQEAAYLAQRAKWARTNDKAYRFKYNHETRERDTGKAEQYRFYQSKQWQALRQQALARDNHLCRYCLAVGKYTAGNTVDHIVPIEFDQSKMTDLDNLAVTCKECHKAKSTWEREYYGTGSHATLKDVQQIKDINLIANEIQKRL